MNIIEKLIPHLIFVAALLPTVLLVVAAGISLAHPDPSIAVQVLPLQAAAHCEPCQTQAAY